MAYKLDAHLKKWCDEHPEYQNLYATWSLNRKGCADALKSVLLNYPHYSMHDASHSEAIISKMEMLLGDRIERLSPTDTWLLLHAAYTHDLGMILTWDDVKKTWESPEFQDFITALSQSEDGDLRHAAERICSKDAHNDNFTWPLDIHRSVRLINAAYFRSRHAKLSRSYIDLLGAALKMDLGHNHMVQSRLLKLLGRICELHTLQVCNVLELPYQVDGFGSDYAHPRFIAMLLRLGDLLDIDNGRFNTVVELTSGDLPESSVPHLEKHEATVHLLVTPKEIEFGSDCPNQKAYLETRNFVTWLEEEIDFLTKYWMEIAPEAIGGYSPRFRQANLLINGVPDVQGVAGLHFEISQSKAFQIIEGSNIYENKFAFIREVIQNAMDASKIQLWRDLNNGMYAAWISSDCLNHLQPYDIDAKIYASYTIRVSLVTLPDGETQIEITDCGTGISVESFKRICNVGVSNGGSEQLTKEIQSMPNWLRPTAGFGIGLQSIFLLADQFEVDTSTGTESFHAVFYSQRAGGHLQLQHTKVCRARGTSIRVIFHTPEQVQISPNSTVERYLNECFDPMGNEDYLGEMLVLDAIKNFCSNSLFPIQITCSENVLNTVFLSSLPTLQDTEIDGNAMLHVWKSWKNRYRVNLSEEKGLLQMWDEDQAMYGEYCMRQSISSSSVVYFKGMEIGGTRPDVSSRGIFAKFDIYGMEAKQNITLDRSSFTPKGYQNAFRMMKDMSSAAIECLLFWLSTCSQQEQERIYQTPWFYPYAFWIACNIVHRVQIPKNLIVSIQDKANVLEKNEDGTWSRTEVSAGQLIPNLESTYFCDIERFALYRGIIDYDYEKVCAIFNDKGLPETDRIIMDKYLIRASQKYYCQRIRIMEDTSPLILYMLTSNPASLIITDNHDRETILRGLSGDMGSVYYWKATTQVKRYAIPTLEGYRDLALSALPFGVGWPRIGPLSIFYYTLSPFDRGTAEHVQLMSRDEFIDLSTASDTFPNVVKYVQKHSPWSEPPSAEQITEQYRKLIGEYYDAMKNYKKESAPGEEQQ